MRRSRRNVSLLLLAAASATAEVPYWIEPCPPAQKQCKSGDPDLARWALEAWAKASGGQLKFVETRERYRAQLRVLWGEPAGGLYGETRPILVNGRPGAELYIRFAVPPTADSLLRDTIVYLTCLHESGHALGLPHTAGFEDIMYNFQYGGDITEYFARYRRRLKTREDIRSNSGISAADQVTLIGVVSAFTR
jgi:hypothetical protein